MKMAEKLDIYTRRDFIRRNVKESISVYKSGRRIIILRNTNILKK